MWKSTHTPTADGFTLSLQEADLGVSKYWAQLC